METTKFPASPGTPLFPLSPERVNGAKLPHNGKSMQSPHAAMPEFGKPSLTVDPFLLTSKSPKSPFRHSRHNSDALVQSMIARFDHMTVKDYRANHENAIKRVEIAREMAEIESKQLKEELAHKDEDTRKVKEEARKLKRELEDAKDRERKVSRRLDVLMEELHRAKDTHNHAVTVYEKEVRRSRKEAFKSSSGLVKLQEELKATRNGFKMSQATLESEKLRSAKHEQDAFTAQYQLVGLQEDFLKARERIKTLEEERNTLKQSLKAEEVSQIAAEGRIALPPPGEDDDADLLASPSKSPRKMGRVISDSEKENVVPKRTLQLKSLQEDLIHEKCLRQKAQDQIEFMKMECQFQCCSCRIAEQTGTKYVHDESYLPEMERIKISVPVQDSTDHHIEGIQDVTEVEYETHLGRDSILRSTPSLIDDFMISKRDFAPLPSFEEHETSHTLQHEQDFDEEHEDEPASPIRASRQEVDEPKTPVGLGYRTVSTTTVVPMMFSPEKVKIERPLSQPNTPKTISHPGQYHLVASPFPAKALKADGTIDREAALELIRQRRGRARSIAMGHATPEKQMVEGNVRRDISAPALKTQTWTR